MYIVRVSGTMGVHFEFGGRAGVEYLINVVGTLVVPK